MFKANLALLPLLLFGSTAIGETKAREYEGSDAGCLIYSVGTIKAGMHFTFPYGRVATLDGTPVSDWKGRIEPKVGGALYLKVKNPDFTGNESGHVVARCLPPGTYEVGDFEFYGSLPGVATYKWSPATHTSLHFHIQSGQATYIGSFMRAPSLGTPLQPILGAAGFFVVADRKERDLPIAKGKLRAGMDIATEVPDVTVLNSQVLRASEP